MNSPKDYTNCISHSPENTTRLEAKSETEILTSLKLAKEQNKKLYVYSKGNNWGYGAKSPQKANSIMLSLEKMNKIHSFDNASGIVCLEPGVSYRDLQKRIEEEGDEWLCPVHGGGPNCSVLANVLERGFGITPIEDHFSSLMSLRSVLPSGQIYESSFSSMKLNDICNSFQWGIGPYMDGLFTQSNLGVVSQIHIKLAPKKEEISFLIFQLKDEIELTNISNKIKKIQRDYGNFIGGVNLMNKERMASMQSEYPSKEKKTGEPISAEKLEKIAHQYHLKNWTLIFSIHGSKKINKIIEKEIKVELKHLTQKTYIFRKSKMKKLSWLANLFPRVGKIKLKDLVSSLESTFEILDGKPNNTALKLAYWLNEKKIDSNSELLPDLDNCGIIWYSPIIPMNKKYLSDFSAKTKEITEKHKFNHLITFTSFNSLSYECTFPILYNKDIPGSAEKAKAFYLELLHENTKLGCHPYRMPLFAMEELKLYKNSPSYKLARDIKKLVDPEEILAPDRYVF